MYWVSNKKAALSLTCRARDVETKIKSIVIQDDFVKANPYTDKEILEDVEIDQLATL
jgi:hypothetical protein